MSHNALQWTPTIRLGNPTQKAVLFALANRADKHGVCWPGVKTIARDMELGESTVRKHLKELEHIGLIARTRRHRTNGSRTSDLYELAIAAKRFPWWSEEMRARGTWRTYFASCAEAWNRHRPHYWVILDPDALTAPDERFFGDLAMEAESGFDQVVSDLERGLSWASSHEVLKSDMPRSVSVWQLCGEGRLASYVRKARAEGPARPPARSVPLAEEEFPF